MATAVIIFGNHGLTHRLDPGLIPAEMGAAINPVTWTPASASKLDEWCCITMMHQILSASDQFGDALQGLITLQMTLRTTWRRFEVKGRTSLGQRPFSTASAHSLLSSTSGLSIS